MKEVDLNNLTTEAKESIKALFSLLAGDEKEVHLSIGGRHTYTISVVSEDTTVAGSQPDSAPVERVPPQTEPRSHGDAPPGEVPSKVSHG